MDIFLLVLNDCDELAPYEARRSGGLASVGSSL